MLYSFWVESLCSLHVERLAPVSLEVALVLVKKSVDPILPDRLVCRPNSLLWNGICVRFNGLMCQWEPAICRLENEIHKDSFFGHSKLLLRSISFINVSLVVNST